MRCVLDAAAFINEQQFQEWGDCYTTSDVLAELKDFKSKEIAQAAMASHKLRVSSPSTASINKVYEVEKEVGCNPKLSETDRGLIALAMDIDAKLVTDDYRMQNVAAHLDIEYEGVMRGTIKEKKKFRS